MSLFSLSRRAFLEQWCKTLASMSVLRFAWGTGALAQDGSALLATWLKDLNELCADLRVSAITPEIWQEHMALLYQGIHPEELMTFIDFPLLQERMSLPGSGAAVERVRFPRLEGMDSPRGFGRKIFGLRQGRAIPPHAHNNMVSAHYIISGAFHVRTYNRRFDLEVEPGFLYLEPSLDTTFRAGDLLTMSDMRDNIHWLVAETETAFTFDVALTDLFSSQVYATPGDRYSMIFLEAPPESGHGPLRTAVIDVEQALARFG